MTPGQISDIMGKNVTEKENNLDRQLLHFPVGKKKGRKRARRWVGTHVKKTSRDITFLPANLKHQFVFINQT